MEKQIVIYLNPFSLTQDVYLVEGKEKEKIGECEVTNPSFREQMMLFGADRNVYHYHLFGAPLFINNLADKLRTDNGISTYSLENNEIIVEVN